MNRIQDQDGKILDRLALGDTVDGIYTVILCPVCGHKTLDNYYICKKCGWEYDSLPPWHYSAANGATLEEYRLRYVGNSDKNGGCYEG
jgi:rubredoxin